MTVKLRPIEARDSLTELTAMLHRAYAELLASGLRYQASTQDVTTTMRRLARGEGYVAELEARVVGTIVVVPPSARADYCAWYDRPDVAVLTQFAVEPAYQRLGIGTQLLAFAEARAAQLGAHEVAVDTATTAAHLVALYRSRGYRHVGDVRWSHANYDSVLLSKRLR